MIISDMFCGVVPIIQVTSLLNLTRPDRLSGENKYFCARCQDKKDALCSQAPTALPPLLIFALNRCDSLFIGCLVLYLKNGYNCDID